MKTKQNPILSALASFRILFGMYAAERKISEQPEPAPNATILSYMGCGASHNVLQSDVTALFDSQEAMELIRDGLRIRYAMTDEKREIWRPVIDALAIKSGQKDW